MKKNSDHMKNLGVSGVVPLDFHSMALRGNGYICARLGTYLCEVGTYL